MLRTACAFQKLILLVDLARHKTVKSGPKKKKKPGFCSYNNGLDETFH